MTTESDTEPAEPVAERAETSGSRVLSAVIIVLILAVAGGLAALTFFTEPTAQREGATKKTAMLVEVIEAKRDDHQPLLVATGTVEPSQDIVLRSQVEGRVVDRSDEFTPGGYVEEGEVLLRLEAADYRHALAQRQSELQDAISALAVEQGRQGAARADYEYLGESLPEENRELVLRQPQLEAAKERISAARAAVDQAKLQLRRTKIRAPFDAHVLRRDADIGSRVSPNDSLGRLVGMNTYWVAVEVPLDKLPWIAIPDAAGEEGSSVRVRNRTAWPKEVSRDGRVFRLVGALDADTRMARVLVEVSDPMAHDEANDGKPPLMVGEFVEAAIHGIPLEDVVRLERDFVRDSDTVWVNEDGELKVRDVEIVVRDAEYAYISSGLEDGDQIVTTNLSTVVDGAPLRLEGESDESGESEEPAE